MEFQQFGDAAIGSLSEVFPKETAYFLSLRSFNAAHQTSDPLEAVVNPLETVTTLTRPSEKDALKEFLPTLGALSLQSVLDDIGSITATEMYESLERTRAAIPASRYQGTEERAQLEYKLQNKRWPMNAARTTMLGEEVAGLLDYMTPKKLRETNITRYASRMWLNEFSPSEQKAIESRVSLGLQYAVSDTLLEMYAKCDYGTGEWYSRGTHSAETVLVRRQKAATGIIDFLFMGFPMPRREAATITQLLSKLR